MEGTTALSSLLLLVLKNLCISSVVYKHSEPQMLDDGGVVTSLFFCLEDAVDDVSSLALVIVGEKVVIVFIGCTDDFFMI